MVVMTAAMRHAAHVCAIARFKKYPEDQEGEGTFARRGRPSRGQSKSTRMAGALQWIIIVVLVLLSGLFSGLTLGLLGLDVNGLEVFLA